MKRSAIQITARIEPGGQVITAKGREAETLRALVLAGPRGLTSLEGFKAGWAVRLSAYIFDLKAMGVPIEKTMEPHGGGSHARYLLAGEVRITSIEGLEAGEVAA